MLKLRQIVLPLLFAGGIVATVFALIPKQAEPNETPQEGAQREVASKQLPESKIQPPSKNDSPAPQVTSQKPEKKAQGSGEKQIAEGSKPRSERREREDDDDERERERSERKRISMEDARKLVEKLNKGEIVKATRSENRFRFEVQPMNGNKIRVEVTSRGVVEIK